MNGSPSGSFPFVILAACIRWAYGFHHEQARDLRDFAEYIFVN